jgi:predicted PurR-regulated permease PerM
MFTCVITVFVLGPLVFAFAALLSESHAVAQDIALADRKGVPVPAWLEDLPVGGPWLAARWESRLAHPGAFSTWAEHADPGALLAWAHSLGQFTLRHALIVLFTILLLFLLYRDGASVAQQLKLFLRQRVGEQAEGYLEVATRAVRASANSLLVLGLFDGIASGIAYLFAGVPHAVLWAAITGALALIPFVGYLAVAAAALHTAVAAGATPALLALGLGCAVLLFGDKIVRPAVVREATHLPFAFVLMSCLGGFEVLGPVGLVIGPVALTVTKELWAQRVRHLTPRAAPPLPAAIRRTGALSEPIT